MCSCIIIIRIQPHEAVGCCPYALCVHYSSHTTVRDGRIPFLKTPCTLGKSIENTAEEIHLRIGNVRGGNRQLADGAAISNFNMYVDDIFVSMDISFCVKSTMVI